MITEFGITSSVKSWRIYAFKIVLPVFAPGVDSSVESQKVKVYTIAGFVSIPFPSLEYSPVPATSFVLSRVKDPPVFEPLVEVP